MAERRTALKFNEYADVLRDIQALHSAPYKKTGQWSLAQICKHLSFYLRGSLEGFPMMLPWIVRVTVGRMLLNRSLKETMRKPGGPTAPQSVYPEQPGDKDAVEEITALLQRLSNHQGQLFPSALFGNITPQQWKTLHLNHAAHHLSFLVPARR